MINTSKGNTNSERHKPSILVNIKIIFKLYQQHIEIVKARCSKMGEIHEKKKKERKKGAESK